GEATHCPASGATREYRKGCRSSLIQMRGRRIARQDAAEQDQAEGGCKYQQQSLHQRTSRTSRPQGATPMGRALFHVVLPCLLFSHGSQHTLERQGILVARVPPLVPCHYSRSRVRSPCRPLWPSRRA